MSAPTLVLPQNASLKGLFIFAALVSLLLSFWAAYQESVINPDAICYLQSAAVVGDGGLRKAMNLCPQAQWPLYSVLIYFNAHLLQVSLTTSAYVLDAVFSLISVLSFIAIVRELGGRGPVLWLAAVVILLAHEFNAIRQYVVRDHGFWAFYLLSVYLLLRYLTCSRWYTALAWGFSLLLATLFRVEGTVFLLMLPWVIWFNASMSSWQRIKGFLQLNLWTAFIGLGVFGWLIFHPEISLASLGRLQEFVFQMFHAGGMVWHRFQESATGFAQTSLTSDSASEAMLIFFLLLLVWYAVKVAVNLSLIYSALALYGLWRKALSLTTPARLVLYGYLLVNVLITGLFMAEHLFLSKRYLLALSLILMVWVPFALNSLLEKWQSQKQTSWAAPLVLLLLIVSALGGIFNFGHSKVYMRQAGDWLAVNVPQQAVIYSNDYQVMYYSQHFGDSIFEKIKDYSQDKALSEERWKDYDYLALRLSKKEAAKNQTYLSELNRAPVQVFSNKHGDEVRIYKIED